MRRLVLTVLSAGVLVTSGIVAGAHADNPIAPVDGGTAVQGCYSAGIPDPAGEVGCHFAQNVTNQAAADCRIADDSNDDCALADGREISAAQMSTFMHSWVHRALSLQDALTSTAPLLEEQLVHTHNSFNSSAYSTYDANGDGIPSYHPTLTNQDPNQVYSLTDQLDMGVRAIELDLHWVPSPYGNASTHGYWVTLCHGDGQEIPNTGEYAHVGCTADRPAQDGFAEVRRWLDANKSQVLLVYLENQLYPADPVASQELAHNTATSLLDNAFRGLIFKPSPGSTSPGHCAPLPYTTSRDVVLASGAQVLLVGNCGPGNWHSDVFERGSIWDEHGDPTNYTQNDCSADAAARAGDTSFRRFFEDSTFLTAATGGPQSLTPDTVAEMVRCGVNIIGMDQLMPQDGRLAAEVWSWAKNDPASSGCAFQGGDGRFHSSSCEIARHYACVDADGWHVTSATGPWAAGVTACQTEFAGSLFSVPVNGYRNAVLQSRNDGGDAWLNYAALPGPAWRANIAPLPGPTTAPQLRGHAYGRGHGRGRPSHSASLY
jgi:hypothetical protein